MTTADKLQMLRMERQKSDLTTRLQNLQEELARSENEKNVLAEESTAKIKQALSLLDTARKEIDKLRSEKETLYAEVTDLQRQNEALKNGPSRGPAQSPHRSPSPKAPRHSRIRTVADEGAGVVLRRNSDEKPLSLSQRMAMFNGNGGGAAPRSHGGGGGGGVRKSWRDNAPPMVSVTTEEDGSPNTRPKNLSNENNNRDRFSMPPNSTFNASRTPSPKVPSPAKSPAPASPKEKRELAASGLSKFKRGVAGMQLAMETEKIAKGIETKPQSNFMNMLGTVAPKAATTVKRANSVAAPGSAASKKAALLHWCQKMTDGHAHVDIKNFSSSWNDGMAFCALFHHFLPSQIDYDSLDPKAREENFTIAFREGEKAGVTPLLDVEDMVEMRNPDWMSVMTYISLIYNHFNGIRVGGPRLPPGPSEG